MFLPALTLLVLSTQAAPGLELFEPTTYHAEEVDLPERSEVLALCDDRLARVPLEARRVHDPLVDDDDQRSGWKLMVPCEAVFLVRGGEGALVEGPVRAATVRRVEGGAGVTEPEPFDAPWDAPSTGPGWRPQTHGPDRVELQLGAAISELVKVRHGDEGGFRLLLRERDREHTLYETAGSDGGHWSLLWAGDLDGDGRLDLVLEASHHDNVRVVRLFLSRDGHLPGPVRESTGC